VDQVPRSCNFLLPSVILRIMGKTTRNTPHLSPVLIPFLKKEKKEKLKKIKKK